MELAFRNFVTISLIAGFFVYAIIVTLADIFVFGIQPSDSEMAFLLAGAIMGSLTSVVTSLYENKKLNDSDAP